MNLYTTSQLAASAGVKPLAVRRHVKAKWLKPEPKMDGVRGYRFSETGASKWLKRHYPGKSLQF